jgi:raffinose/stachyose/melibiose transport system permease protein
MSQSRVSSGAAVEHERRPATSTSTPAAPPPTTGRRRRERRRGGVNWLLTLMLLAVSLAVLLPLWITVVTALQTPEDAASGSLAFPAGPQWGNFGAAAELTDFPRALFSSLLVTVIAVSLTLLTNSMVAYAIARTMDGSRLFKGLYFYFISALFVPFAIVMLPIAKLTSLVNLDNRIGLALIYVIFGLSLNIFIYVGYLRSIPRELEEAASVDGASTWRTFWSVIFPLLTPINATVGIITCVWVWNDFMLPLVLLSDRDTFTLPLVQYAFQGQFTTDYSLAFASYLMALTPLLLVYVLAQRWVIGGVTRGSVK